MSHFPCYFRFLILRERKLCLWSASDSTVQLQCSQDDVSIRFPFLQLNARVPNELNVLRLLIQNFLGIALLCFACGETVKTSSE